MKESYIILIYLLVLIPQNQILYQLLVVSKVEQIDRHYLIYVSVLRKQRIKIV
jgi:hypothetical protein